MSLVRHNSGLWVHRGKFARQDADVINEVMCHDGYMTKTLPTTGAAGELIIDIGAHIGTFPWMWRCRNCYANIVCVEANPDNLECLKANVDDFATVLHAACTYEKDFQFVNSICENGLATGGSYLAPKGEAVKGEYRLETRTIPTITLEEIVSMVGAKKIHILKLDCEGSEFSILANTTLLPQTKYVIGEYHGRERWNKERVKWFEGWDYTLLRGGNIGSFIYENRNH